MRKTNLMIKGVVSKPYYLITIIVLGILTLSSCSKEGPKEVTPDGSTKLSITIGSIIDEDLVSSSDAKMMSIAPKTATGEQITSSETVKFNDIEVDITSAEGHDLSFGEHAKAISFEKVRATLPSKQMSTRTLNPLAADIPMEIGVKYWFVLFNPATQKFEQSLQLVSGTSTKLDVVRNQNYEWYAYSYDDTDDITALDPNNPQIQTKPNRPFLYAKGTIKATTTGDTPLSITFKHQLQQLKIRLNTRGLFGNITSLLAKFAANTPVKTRAFDIKTGGFTGTLTNVPIADLTFSKIENDSERQVEARYYTADLSQRSYTIDIEKLSVKYPNNTVEDLPVSSLGLADRTFGFTKGGAGWVQYAEIKAFKVIPTKSILHIEGNDTYSYAASNPAKASGAFLRDPRNFSAVSKYVRVQGFTHDIQGSTANTLRNKLSNPANYPDIIIAGMFTGFTQADYDALEIYVRRGGVVFLMIENTNLGRPEVFFQRIFNSQAVTMKLYDISGSIYKLNNVDSDVLGWPFGDTRGKYWGQDGSSTFYIENIPASEKENIFIYSESAVNRNNQQPGSVSMFRHKTFNLFYVGDTGMLSNEKQWGQYGSTTIEPYATDQNNFPVAHTAYGRLAQSSSPEAGTPAGGWHVHNSVIFGNVFAHLIAQSHYMTLDRSPFTFSEQVFFN